MGHDRPLCSKCSVGLDRRAFKSLKVQGTGLGLKIPACGGGVQELVLECSVGLDQRAFKSLKVQGA